MKNACVVPGAALMVRVIGLDGPHACKVLSVGEGGFTADFELLAWPRSVMFADLLDCAPLQPRSGPSVRA